MLPMRQASYKLCFQMLLTMSLKFAFINGLNHWLLREEPRHSSSIIIIKSVGACYASQLNIILDLNYVCSEWNKLRNEDTMVVLSN